MKWLDDNVEIEKIEEETSWDTRTVEVLIVYSFKSVHGWVRGRSDDWSQRILFKWPCYLPPLDPEALALVVGGLDPESPSQDPVQSPMRICLHRPFTRSSQTRSHPVTRFGLRLDLGRACSNWRKEGETTTSMWGKRERTVQEGRKQILWLIPPEGD